VGGGWEGWRGRVGGLMMLSDTGDQVVCTVDQTDGHSSPYHIMSRAGVQWNRIGPQATLLMPLKQCWGRYFLKVIIILLITRY